jgi:hypothetical protein
VLQCDFRYLSQQQKNFFATERLCLTHPRGRMPIGLSRRVPAMAKCAKNLTPLGSLMHSG